MKPVKIPELRDSGKTKNTIDDVIETDRANKLIRQGYGGSSADFFIEGHIQGVQHEREDL